MAAEAETFVIGERCRWSWDGGSTLGNGTYLGKCRHGDAVVQSDDRSAGDLLLVPIYYLLKVEPAPTPAPITVQHLAQLLDEECERDSWGTIDPWLFKTVAQDGVPIDAADDDAADGMRKLLGRVVERLNKP